MFPEGPHRRGGGMRTLDRGPEERLRSDSVTDPLSPTSSSRRLVRSSGSIQGAAGLRSRPPTLRCIFPRGREWKGGALEPVGRVVDQCCHSLRPHHLAGPVPRSRALLQALPQRSKKTLLTAPPPSKSTLRDVQDPFHEVFDRLLGPQSAENRCAPVTAHRGPGIRKRVLQEGLDLCPGLHPPQGQRSHDERLSVRLLAGGADFKG